MKGTNAEHHVVDERIVALKPKSLNPCYAASFPLVGLTAWEGLFEQLKIPLDVTKNEGKSILILGGAGGVGSLTIQLAKRLAVSYINQITLLFLFCFFIKNKYTLGS